MNKYKLNPEGTATVLEEGETGCWRMAVHTRTHDGWVGVRETRICFYGFRRGNEGIKQEIWFPPYTRELAENGGGIRKDLLSDLLNMSHQSKLAEEKDGEITQMLESILQSEKEGKIDRKLERCGPTCLYPLQLEFNFLY